MLQKKPFDLIKSVYVIGSTSEVAQSLCLELAKNGCEIFHLVARDDTRNIKFAEKLSKYGCFEITTEHFDLCSDFKIKGNKPLLKKDFDLYLIAAGYLGDNKKARKNNSEALRIFDSNVRGLIPWINAIVTEERLKNSSRLWVLSSVAADRGRPSNYYYGAAKAALNIFFEGLLIRSSNKPFCIRIIKSGFIRTKMIKTKEVSKLLSISTTRISKILLRNINKRGFEYLPFWWAPVMFIVKLLPHSIMRGL